jgi:anti-anti-sigma factor
MKLTLDEVKSTVGWLQCEGPITQEATFADPLRDQFGVDIYTKRIALDLSHASRIDSSGVSWLLACQRRFRENGGRMILAAVPPTVMDVFRVLSLDQSFTIADRGDVEKLFTEEVE